MFPRQFFQDKPTIKCIKTATCTGILEDPLELVTSSRPWRMLTADLTQSLEKKSLIFADHFYQYRSKANKAEINQKLQKAKQTGFSIFILSPTGYLNEWDETALANEYRLNLQQFNSETILDLAYHQQKWSANHVFILDYFGINDLLNCDHYLIQLHYFLDHPDDLRQLIKNSALSNYILQLNANQCQDLKNTSLQIIDEIKNKTLECVFNSTSEVINFKNNLKPHQLNYLKQITIFNQDYNLFEELTPLLHAPLEKMCLDLKIHHGIVPALKKNQLTNLKVCHIFAAAAGHNVRVSSILLPLLIAAPNLEELYVSAYMIENNTLDEAKPGQFPHLKIVAIQDGWTEVPCNVINILLQAAPSLIELRVSNSCIAGLDELKDKNLSNLIRVSCTLSGSGLFQLMRITPHLEEASFSVFSADSGHFDKSIYQWQNLKIMSLKHSSDKVNKNFIKQLFLATPYLEELEIEASSFNILPTCMQLNQMNFLKKIWIKNPYCKRIDVAGLFTIAPYLEQIEMDDANSLNMDDIKLLPSLKKILFRNISSNFDNLTTLVKHTPFLEEINLPEDNYYYFRGLVNYLENARSKVKIIFRKKESTNYYYTSAIYPLSTNEQKTDTNSTQLSPEFIDTRHNKDKTLAFSRYFSCVEPSSYRLNLWHPDLDSLTAPLPLEPTDFKEIEFKDEIFSEESPYCCTGIKPVTAVEGKKILLPSLEAEEKLFALQVVNKEGKLVEHTLEYSESTQFYRVILPNQGDFTIRYQVKLPNDCLSSLPSEIKNIVKKYNAFNATNQPPSKNFKSLRELNKYVRDFKTGACRHRALAAYEELEKEYQEDVRIVLNDLHAYLEIRHQKHWYKIDLGGYFTQTKEKSMSHVYYPTSSVNSMPLNPLTDNSIISDIIAESKMSSSNSKEEIIPNASPDKKYIIPLEIKSPLSQDSNISNILVCSSSDTATQDFYEKIKENYAVKQIFIAHKPEDLSLTSIGITEKGEPLPNYTALGRWLKEIQHSKSIIIVDVRKFNASDLVKLNDLLDGRIENLNLPNNIRVILLDSPMRDYYGPDFKRRVNLESKIVFSAPTKAILANLPAVTMENKQNEKTNTSLEVDLFHSHLWERELLGYWEMAQVDSQTFSFAWKKSELLSSLSNKLTRAIIFKHPPLEDFSFTQFLTELNSLRQLKWADQQILVTQDVHFYISNENYPWDKWSQLANLSQLRSDLQEIEVLGNNNLLSFIQDPYLTFSKKNNQLDVQDSHLTHCQKNNKNLQVVCAPGLSEGNLARLLTEAARKQVKINFYTANLQCLPTQSPLYNLHLEFKTSDSEENGYKCDTVQWEIHEDGYLAAKHYSKMNPKASCIDLSCLETAELGRYPLSVESFKEKFLAEGKLAMSAPMSAIIKKLLAGETIILNGKIPPSLYEPLTALSLGMFEGEHFKGKLIILAKPEDSIVVAAITGKKLQPIAAPAISRFKKIDVWTSNQEEKAAIVDEERLTAVMTTLKSHPWVMLEGSTGIGKTYFLHHQLPKDQTYFDINTWLTTKPADGKQAILIIDEASFMSQLSSEGENFLERFKSLDTNNPGFFWKGNYYPLTTNHKVIFAFNPASYGAGRDTKGILSEQAVLISFKPLPSFYIRERVLLPLFEKLNIKQQDLIDSITQPCLAVYQFLANKSITEEVLITPRQVKTMVNLIVSEMIQDKLTGEKILSLTKEIAYLIGHQALSDHSHLLRTFDQQFKPTQQCLAKQLPKHYLTQQKEAYCFIQTLIDTKYNLSLSNADLGFGGVLLEGKSGIGKSYFVNQIAEEYKLKTGRSVYRISPSTPYHEKEKILQQADNEGGLLVAEEINSCLMPNKFLNHCWDEETKLSKNTVLVLFTQNPPSFSGRSTEDPALRQRLIKIKLNWDLYSPSLKRKDEEDKKIKNNELAKLPQTLTLFSLPTNQNLQSPTQDKNLVNVVHGKTAK